MRLPFVIHTKELGKDLAATIAFAEGSKMGLRIGRAAVAGRDMAGGIIRRIVTSVPAAASRAG